MRVEDAKFSRFITAFLMGGLIYGDRVNMFYLSHVRFLNYAFVCGVVGVLVNYTVYHVLVLGLWEPAAFYVAVGVAALSNYTFTVGPMGHLFGLEKEQNEK